jgi:DNA-binding transcriptional MerR regulator
MNEEEQKRAQNIKKLMDEIGKTKERMREYYQEQVALEHLVSLIKENGVVEQIRELLYAKEDELEQKKKAVIEHLSKLIEEKETKIQKERKELHELEEQREDV